MSLRARLIELVQAIGADIKMLIRALDSKPGTASALVGDGTSTQLIVTHNLGTVHVVVGLQDAATGTGVQTDWRATSATTVELTFSVAPTLNQYRVTVIG